MNEQISFYTKPGVILTESCGEYFLINGNRVKLQINETTAFFWKLLENGADINTLIKAGMEHFEDSDSVILKKDITDLLDLLNNKELIFQLKKHYELK